MSRAHILVVDDEPFNIEIIAEYLDESGYSIDTASSGSTALAALAQTREDYDLVILDRMMPDVDGITLLRQMKADERLRGIPVIMQTAAATPDQVREGLAAGAHYYLTKPFEADSLRSIIRAALSDRERRSELLSRIAEHGTAMQLVERAEFSIRTLEEANALAVTAALVCHPPDSVAMGLAELLVNGVEHGNLGIDFKEKGRLKEDGSWGDEVARRLALPEHAGKRVKLLLEKRGAEWHFTVRDQGKGFDWHKFLELDPERAFAPNGRGIVLARQIGFSGLEYQGNGNTVHAWVSASDGGAR